MNKTDIEWQLKSHKWLNQLSEDQIKLNKTVYQSFGDEYKGDQLKTKFKNITTRKKKKNIFYTDYPIYSNFLNRQDDLAITSEDRLRDIAEIYTKVPTDHTKKIDAAKYIFSNIIKQIPPESHKKFKIDYNQSDNIDIEEVKKCEPLPDKD